MKDAAFPINRRELMHLAATAGTATWLAVAQAQNPISNSVSIIDTNINLFQWPFRRLPLDRTILLVKKLRGLGITQVWASSFEGVLNRDLTGVNQRLADECQRFPELVPIGVINPALPGWKQDLSDCIEKHQMPGVRLFPNYHGYTLADSRFAELLSLAAKAKRFVQLAVCLEDTRTQHPLLNVADVDVTSLPKVLEQIPNAKVQLLNLRPTPAMLQTLSTCSGLYFDVARVEGTDGVPKLVESLPAGQVLFGTHAPFLIPEAALIRLHESSLLSSEKLQDVLGNNAQELLKAVQA